jgi:hypothetical protein
MKYLTLFSIILLFFGCGLVIKNTDDNENVLEIEIISNSENGNDSGSRDFSPFCPQTEIIFQLESEEPVIFRIYDVVGNLEFDTSIENVRIGSNTIVIKQLRGLESGVYYYAIQQNGNILEKKQIILMK